MHPLFASPLLFHSLRLVSLSVIRESHRRHPEPNLQHASQVIPQVAIKPLYAYTDSFGFTGKDAHKDYYLASIFTHIHLQQQGEFNFPGLSYSQFFLRGALDQYGITAHVFKHGQFKTATNILSETKFNQPHRENMICFLQDISANIYEEITQARSKNLDLTAWLTRNQKVTSKIQVWKQIQESGSFPAITAWKTGFVDYLPRRNPLPELLKCGSGECLPKLEKRREPWEADFERFNATEMIHIVDYAKRIERKRNPRFTLLNYISNVVKKYTETSPKPITEKIALLHIEENISNGTTFELVSALRKIKADKTFKCIVLRVDSPGGSVTPCETIRQELAGTQLPIVVSIGNTAASGGYYLSAEADRIFASNKSITGSIGVFSVRLDLTKFLERYGVTVDHITMGDLSALGDCFHPLTWKMNQQLLESVDRHYSHFKNIVSEGRKLDLDNVEALAQGRVFTGLQAKTNGLVDEIGGLHRALAYAQRHHTVTGKAAIWKSEQEFYGRVQTLLRSLFYGEETNQQRFGGMFVQWMAQAASQRQWRKGGLSGVFLTQDENAAIQCLLSDMFNDSQYSPDYLPSSFWE